MVTAEAIAFHAAERPDGTALVVQGREISYADLDRDITRFVRALAALRVSPGDLVAIGTENNHLHCLLLIAVEQLGAASASFLPHEGENSRPLLSRADLVLTDTPHLASGARRCHSMTETWLADVRSLPCVEDRATHTMAAEDPVRVLRTSGTTGTMKMAMLRRRQHEGRLQRYGAEYQFTERSRYLLTMPFTVGHIYGSVMACLRAGGTVVLDSGRLWRAGDAPLPPGITDVTLMPILLKQMLDTLPSDFTKPDRLTVCTFGAPISAALRDRALARLATIVYGDYGCNEVGLISLTRSGDPGGRGTIWPGVRVQVVDESDRPVPSGEAGRIRVQTEFMVDGYLDDPEATKRMFRNGWFYPGDLGILHGERHLQVLGRSDELLNIGGTKCPPEVLEALIARIVPVKDVAVCTLQNADGLEEIWVAVIADRVANDVLQARVLGALQAFQLGYVHITRLADIPRNEAGKIQRDRLRHVLKSIRR